MQQEQATQLQHWLTQDVLPLWTGIGIDTDTGTVWEALHHDGRPAADLPRRLRVQVRQAYCFAQTGHVDLAQQLFRFAMTQGFDPETGNLAAWLAPDLSHTSAPHESYDMAFMLLAAAALTCAGVDVAADLARLEQALARLRAPRGWYENIAQSTPRRQNPHMHLFEASTALFAATGDESWRAVAQECLSLFREVFLTQDHQVLEFFEADWTPLVGTEQAIEPGHMAEWVYLLDRYETVTGTESGIDLEALFAAAWAHRDGQGLLPDHAGPNCDTRRLWPQTELLKAALVLDWRGMTLPEAARPARVMNRLWDGYLDVETPGGWYDKRGADGALLSQNMPASSFYHILVAVKTFLGQEVA